MFITKLTILTAAFILCLAAEKKCPYQWVEFSGHCYQFVTEHWRNYFAASQECEKLGAHLVYLDTDDEITWVKGYRLHNDIGLTSSPLWTDGLGLQFYEDKNRTWHWRGKWEVPKVHDWAPGEPKKEDQKFIMCLALTRDHQSCGPLYWRTLGWKDAYCHTPLNYICKKTKTNSFFTHIL